MLYREIIAVCSQIHTKHINTLCGQNVELLNVKQAVQIIHWALKGLNSGCDNLEAGGRILCIYVCMCCEQPRHCERPKAVVCVGCGGFVASGRDWVKDCFGRRLGIEATVIPLPAFIPLAALPEFSSNSHCTSRYYSVQKSFLWSEVFVALGTWRNARDIRSTYKILVRKSQITRLFETLLK